MKKVMTFAALAIFAVSVTACAGSADNRIYVEDWGDTATYSPSSKDSASVRAKRAERLYNKSLRK